MFRLKSFALVGLARTFERLISKVSPTLALPINGAAGGVNVGGKIDEESIACPLTLAAFAGCAMPTANAAIPVRPVTPSRATGFWMRFKGFSTVVRNVLLSRALYVPCSRSTTHDSRPRCIFVGIIWGTVHAPLAPVVGARFLAHRRFDGLACIGSCVKLLPQACVRLLLIRCGHLRFQAFFRSHAIGP